MLGDVIKIRAERGGAETIPEHSPTYASQSNGVVERGIQSVEGIITSPSMLRIAGSWSDLMMIFAISHPHSLRSAIIRLLANSTVVLLGISVLIVVRVPLILPTSTVGFLKASSCPGKHQSK